VGAPFTLSFGLSGIAEICSRGEAMNYRSLVWRVVFSLFLAVIACGMSFYVILFVSLTIMAITHQANPATTPTLQANLRYIVLPISALASVAVFVITLRRSGKRDEVVVLPRRTHSNKPAA
jgi:TRAP-type C4-dicarboxylate transport system permease small subunit